MNDPPRARRPTPDLLLAAAVLVGLLLRSSRYFARASFWGDEAYLLLNLRHYPLGRLLTGRLDAIDVLLNYPSATQAGPPGFLAVLKLLTPPAGPASEMLLRAMPFAFSCAALLVFAVLARRLFPGLAWAAVLALACHEEVIGQAAKVKHYGIDVFAAVLLAHLAVTARLSAAARIVAIAAAALPLMGFSYAPVIVAPVALAAAWRRGDDNAPRSSRPWLCLACLAAVAVAALALHRWNVSLQRDAFLSTYWAGAFPDWRRPLAVPAWLASNTYEFWNYAAPGLIVGLALVVAQLALIPARRTDAVTIMLLGPWLATLAAALLGLFPYQGRRVDLFLVPFLFLASLRAAADLAALLRARPTRPLLAALPLAALVVPGLLGAVEGVRSATTGAHDNGRFRQLATELLAARHPDQQIAAVGPGPSALALAYVLEQHPGVYTDVTLEQLDPQRPVLLLVSTRTRPADRARILADTPALRGRSVRSERTVGNTGVLLDLSAAPER